jgi:citrate lyase gamma subunit
MTVTTHDADVVIRIEPWMTSDHVKIRVTDGYRQQLQSLLTEAHLDNSQALEFSAASTAMELISVTVSTPEFWEALGAVIVAFLQRHGNKRVRVEISDRTGLDLTGYSRRDVERLLRVAAEMHEQATERWERLIEQPPSE